MIASRDTFDRSTIAKLIAKLKEAPTEQETPDGSVTTHLPLFGWDRYRNPTAVLERRDDRILVARLLPVVDPRLPAGTELVELQVRWKNLADVELDNARPTSVVNWLAETVYLSLLAAHLVKAAPSQTGSQLTFRTPYLAWWRYGTLLVTQTHPLLLGVSPEVVAGTSYAGLAWYAPERAWIQGRGLPGLWGHRVSTLANRALEIARTFRQEQAEPSG